MYTYWNTIRRFNRDVILYLVFNSSIAFAYLGTINVLLNLYLLRLGYSTEFIGPMLASGMIIWGVLALPAGAVGARLGLKRSIVISMFILAASALMLIGAGWLPAGWRAPGLVASWMLLWAGAALVSVNSLPYIMAITDDENRSYVFAFQQALAALVTLLGSLISGVLPGVLARLLGVTLDQPLPYQLTMLLGPVFYLIAGLVFLKIRPVSTAEHASGAGQFQAAPLGVLALLFLIFVLQSISDGAARTFFNIYLDASLGMPVAQIGAAMGLSQVLPAAGSLLIPLMIARMGTRGAMLASNTLSVLFILLMAAIPNGTAAALAFMGFTAAGSITAITRSIYSQEEVNPRWRTISSAIATLGIALGWAASAWLGGSLITVIGFKGLFLSGALMALLASALTLVRVKAPSTLPGETPEAS